ncbi:MAG: hypothetical protein K2Y22_15515 [Candidatus Obscuribacterales bacterium]|nr:hypothetical protein [Candidatus Obscuribacterales bacterium]
MTTSTIVAAKTPCFFPVSRFKLTVMSVCTLNFYLLWWTFKNWLYVSNIKKKKVLPFMRSWFSPLYLHSLLLEIRDTGTSMGFAESFSPIRIYVSWLIIFLAGVIAEYLEKMPTVMADTKLNTMLSHSTMILDFVGLLAFVPLLFVQKYINDLNLTADPNCEINSKFTKGNWVLITIGCLSIILSLLSSCFPESQCP